MVARQKQQLVDSLKARFEAHPQRHPGLVWSAVGARLDGQPASLDALAAMEASGGEPDVIAVDAASGVLTFADCAAESPKGRRSLCYDREALDARKAFKPAGNVVELAAAMGIELMTEADYRALQRLGEFDLKTSSWLATPAPIRALGGAIFGDRRYDQVFVYHNGAQSYYAARGFRGILRV